MLQGRRIGRLIGFDAAMLLALAALGQPVDDEPRSFDDVVWRSPGLLAYTYNAGGPGPNLQGHLRAGATRQNILDEWNHGAGGSVNLDWATLTSMRDADCPGGEGAGLCVRRAREIRLFLDGIYPTSFRL